MSEEMRKPGPPGPWSTTMVIGKRILRVDGYERVSGSAVYPSDVTFPDMLYGAILRCPWPNARILSVDVSDAEKMEGVHAVISGRNPEADIVWPYSKEMSTKLFDPVCRYEGEPVAAVAAATPYQARDAALAVKVRYEQLPFVADERKALDDGAPRVHEIGNRVTPVQTYERGNIERGFAEADVVLEETYRTECEIHTPMELHGCVAKWERDRLTLWESTQGVYAVQSKVAEVLGLPLSKVRVIGHYMGGAFGSKLQPGKYTIIAALLAKITARPVKLFLTREESFLAVGNRPPANMRVRAGAKRDGRLTALYFSDLGTGGAYPAGGTAFVDWVVRDLYACPNVKTDLSDVYINAGPSRPFRAPGHPQGAWALEQMIDALAEAIQMDPVEIRLKNIPLHSQARQGNPPYTTTGLRECLLEGAKTFKWQEARQKAKEARGGSHVRRGVGVASALWVVGSGRPPSTALVKLFADGSANLNMGASDIGTGTKTIMAMVVAEELGVKPEAVQIENADTGTTQYATPSGGSKTVPTEAPAVRAASLSVKEQLLALAAQDLKTEVSTLTLRNGEIVSVADPSKKLRISDVTGLKEQGVLVGIGYRGPNPSDKITCPFSAQFCEVEVDTKTGEVKILRFVGANESGRVMDALTYDNQVFGGITMGIGLAMTEARILDVTQTGKMLNRNWHDYKIPTALDVPAEMVSVPLDRPDAEANTAGAKGLGEPVTIPTAAAVANAIYDATGVRITASAMTPAHLCGLFARIKQTRKEKKEA